VRTSLWQHNPTRWHNTTQIQDLHQHSQTLFRIFVSHKFHRNPSATIRLSVDPFLLLVPGLRRPGLLWKLSTSSPYQRLFIRKISPKSVRDILTRSADGTKFHRFPNPRSSTYDPRSLSILSKFISSLSYNLSTSQKISPNTVHYFWVTQWRSFKFCPAPSLLFAFGPLSEVLCLSHFIAVNIPGGAKCLCCVPPKYI